MKPPGTATPNASARKSGRGVGDTADSGKAMGDDTPAKALPPSPGAVTGFGGGGHPFGQHLEPILQDACGGRLSPINWFRTDWQRGGALTGYAALTDGDGAAHDVVVKLPVPPRERDWLLRLQGEDPADRERVATHPGYAAPRLFAHGESLNGYDLAWVVMERVPHGPLGGKWNGHEFDLLIDAAGRFYERAATVPVDEPRKHHDWEGLLRKSREVARSNRLPDAQGWKRSLKAAGKKLDGWLAVWHARPMDDWCHGDLHLGNAMSRLPPDQAPTADDKTLPNHLRGSAVLLDLAEVRPGHWVEDAVYCEHLYWARRDLLAGRKLCSMLAKERRRYDLGAGDEWVELAQIKRCLLALATPCWLDADGDPRHVAAALAVLEQGGG